MARTVVESSPIFAYSAAYADLPGVEC